MHIRGLEQVAVFAGETKNPGRAIMLSAWIAAPAVVVIYAVMTGSMLTYVPASKIDLAGPIPQVLAAALGQGAGVWLGRVMILALGGFYRLLVHDDHGRDQPFADGGGVGLDSSGVVHEAESAVSHAGAELVRDCGDCRGASFLASVNAGRQEAFPGDSK